MMTKRARLASRCCKLCRVYRDSRACTSSWEQMRGGIVRNQAAAAGHIEQEGARYEVVFNSQTDRTSRQALLGASQ